MPLFAEIAERQGPRRRLGVVFALLLVATTAARAEQAPAAAPATAANGPSTLQSGLDTIEQHFLQPIPRDQLEAKALQALLEKLDPYSQYLDASQLETFRDDLGAEFGGIGIDLEFDDPAGYPRIDHLLYGGVAGAAGVQRGDWLLAVGGKDVRGQSSEQIEGELRGAVGSTVAIRVRRDETAAALEFSLQRVAIDTPSVRALRRDATGNPDWWLDHERRLGYARVASLATDTTPILQRVIAELERGHARGLVLDLRDCPGGLMQAALASANLFVASGRLLTIRQRGQDTVYDAKRGDDTQLPLVVLINGGTVSAGEILAAALADNHRATLVGERSFGKGRIQTLYSLGEGRGALVLTTGTFQRPNGKTIDVHDVPEGSPDVGIAPDIEVKMSEDEHAAWLEFAEKTTGTLVLAPEEQQGAPPDRVLARAVELLLK